MTSPTLADRNARTLRQDASEVHAHARAAEMTLKR